MTSEIPDRAHCHGNGKPKFSPRPSAGDVLPRIWSESKDWQKVTFVGSLAATALAAGLHISGAVADFETEVTAAVNRAEQTMLHNDFPGYETAFQNDLDTQRGRKIFADVLNAGMIPTEIAGAAISIVLVGAGYKKTAESMIPHPYNRKPRRHHPKSK